MGSSAGGDPGRRMRFAQQDVEGAGTASPRAVHSIDVTWVGSCSSDETVQSAMVSKTWVKQAKQSGS